MNSAKSGSSSSRRAASPAATLREASRTRAPIVELLGGRRQLARLGARGAAPLEQRDYLVHGFVEAGRDDRPGALRLDQAKAGEVGLGGEEGEHGA